MQHRFVIVRDNREKKPLIFPRSLVTLVRPKPLTFTTVLLGLRKERLDKYHADMKKGDYYLEGFPHCTVIERKGSIDEVTTNVFTTHRRKLFIEELAYLRDRCADPILLFEGSTQTVITQGFSKTPAGVAFDGLLDLLHEYKMRWFLLPSDSKGSRLATGEVAARLLLRGAINHG